MLIRTTGSGGEASHSSVPGAQAAGRDDEAVDAPLDEQVEVAGFALRVVGGVAQQDRVALGPGGVLDRADQLREVRVLDVGDDQAERLGRASLERAGDARRSVVEVARRGQDARLASRDERGPRPASTRLTVAVETFARGRRPRSWRP